MSWVRVSDEFASRPQLVSAGAHAMAVAVWALCESSTHLTDGRIDDGMLKSMPWVIRPSARERAFGALEVAGFWKRNGDGYDIVDPFQYLQKSDDVKERRRKAAERQAAWRDRQKKGRNAPSNAVTSKGRNAPPDPYPEGRRGVGTASADAAVPNPHSACPICELPHSLHEAGCSNAELAS